MLADAPLASAEILQSSRVDHYVAQLASGRWSQLELESALASTHGGVVRHRKLYTHQPDDGLEEFRGGPETEVEDRLHH